MKAFRSFLDRAKFRHHDPLSLPYGADDGTQDRPSAGKRMGHLPSFSPPPPRHDDSDESHMVGRVAVEGPGYDPGWSPVYQSLRHDEPPAPTMRDDSSTVTPQTGGGTVEVQNAAAGSAVGSDFEPIVVSPDPLSKSQASAAAGSGGDETQPTVPTASQLLGGGSTPRKNDGMPWYDDEDEDHVPALRLDDEGEKANAGSRQPPVKGPTLFSKNDANIAFSEGTPAGQTGPARHAGLVETHEASHVDAGSPRGHFDSHVRDFHVPRNLNDGGKQPQVGKGHIGRASAHLEGNASGAHAPSNAPKSSPRAPQVPPDPSLDLRKGHEKAVDPVVRPLLRSSGSGGRGPRSPKKSGSPSSKTKPQVSTAARSPATSEGLRPRLRNPVSEDSVSRESGLGRILGKGRYSDSLGLRKNVSAACDYIPHTVRQIVDAAYTEAVQEEARSPAGGLRRIVELLRQNDQNRLAVENIAISIAVISENDSIASDAFGNHGAIEALLLCIKKYDGNTVVTKRLVQALRNLVTGSRRNGKLLEAYEGIEKLAQTASSTRYQDEPSIAIDSLRTLGAALDDPDHTPGRASPAHNRRTRSGSDVSPGSSRVRRRKGAERVDSDGHDKKSVIRSALCSVTMAMDLHEHRSEVAESGIEALQGLLSRVERGSLETSVFSDIVEATSTAFELHGSSSIEISWLSLSLLCDVDEARETHMKGKLDMSCFFGSLNRVLIAVETESSHEVEEAGARLIGRALRVATHARGNVVDAGVVSTSLEILRVFKTRPCVLENLCGLMLGLLDSTDARPIVEAKTEEFSKAILAVIATIH